MNGYVYIQTEPNLWTCGHYPPEGGRFVPESDHDNKSDAAARVIELNGGAKAEKKPAGAAEVVGLRDLFAAHALAGYLASHTHSTTPGPTRASERAYEYADAMVAARLKEGDPDAE